MLLTQYSIDKWEIHSSGTGDNEWISGLFDFLHGLKHGGDLKVVFDEVGIHFILPKRNLRGHRGEHSQAK